MTINTLPPQHLEVQNFIKKIIVKKWFWIIFLSFSFSYPIVRSLNRELPPPPPVLYKLPDYQLINQFGKSFGSKDLKGRVYLANFIFTRCSASCKKITEAMFKIQKRMKGLGNHVAIVSFTVDPDFDTPNVLFKYSRENKANPFIWYYLTGAKNQVQNIVVDGFKLIMGDLTAKEAPELVDIAHSEKIAFVDHLGQIRGFYAIDENSVNQLMIDLGVFINLPIQNKI